MEITSTEEPKAAMVKGSCYHFLDVEREHKYTPHLLVHKKCYSQQPIGQGPSFSSSVSKGCGETMGRGTWSMGMHHLFYVLLNRFHPAAPIFKSPHQMGHMVNVGFSVECFLLEHITGR